MVRRIGVVTTSRADYGILRPVIRAINEHPGLHPLLFVTGSHLSPAFGMTIEEIKEDGWDIAAEIESLFASSSATSIAKASGVTMLGFADAYRAVQPDMILLLGDRFELFAAAATAVPFNIPIAHIHGGELSLGAIDDSFRHAITKLAHLHFPATQSYARRIAQMGEEDWRITVSGAPALDTIARAETQSRESIEKRFAISLEGRPLLVTFHPVTRETNQLTKQIEALKNALLSLDYPLLMTGSNADIGGNRVTAMLKSVAETRSDAYFVESLGSTAYLGTLAHVGAMVGNSSSGIIEAASFALPVVNIGNRQSGRDRARNVIDCEPETDAIVDAVRTALSPEFEKSLIGLRNPYGDGGAGSVIANRLSSVPLNEALVVKRFQDCPSNGHS